MGYGRWITGALGWVLGGPIGGLIGYFVGSLADGSISSSVGGNAGQRNSFLISLLVLSSAVMHADGKVMRSELDYVKGFIRANFGEEAVAQALSILKELSQKEVDLQQVCAQIKACMQISQRLQLLHYLVGISQADGAVSGSELEMLRKIAQYMGISERDSESVLAMFGNNIEDAYKVLEIDSSVTDEEVKRAYKRMAMKHHPDRVATLGADVRCAAEEKFKSIVAAYETIKKERNFA
jgi:DnaJ like chaperone protein